MICMSQHVLHLDQMTSKAMYVNCELGQRLETSHLLLLSVHGLGRVVLKLQKPCGTMMYNIVQCVVLLRIQIVCNHPRKHNLCPTLAAQAVPFEGQKICSLLHTMYVGLNLFLHLRFAEQHGNKTPEVR